MVAAVGSGAALRTLPEDTEDSFERHREEDFEESHGGHLQEKSSGEQLLTMTRTDEKAASRSFQEEEKTTSEEVVDRFV